MTSTVAFELVGYEMVQRPKTSRFSQTEFSNVTEKNHLIWPSPTILWRFGFLGID